MNSKSVYISVTFNLDFDLESYIFILFDKKIIYNEKTKVRFYTVMWKSRYIWPSWPLTLRAKSDIMQISASVITV